MARSRMIKPEFWADEKTGQMSDTQKCLFIGMWNFADDEGLLRSNPAFVKAQILPYDSLHSVNEIDAMIDDLEKLGLIMTYTSNNEKYLWIVNFRNHQRIDKPQNAKHPHPSFQNTKYRESVYRRDHYTCYLCGSICSPVVGSGLPKPSIDHVKPRSKGGSDYPSNLKTACEHCNKSKKDNDIPIPFQEYSANGSDETLKEKETRSISETETIASVERVEEFWSLYPNKVDRRMFDMEWMKGHCNEIADAIIQALQNQIRERELKTKYGLFVPVWKHPKSWIAGKCWNDAVMTEQQMQAQSTKPKPAPEPKYKDYRV